MVTHCTHMLSKVAQLNLLLLVSRSMFELVCSYFCADMLHAFHASFAYIVEKYLNVSNQQPIITTTPEVEKT